MEIRIQTVEDVGKSKEPQKRLFIVVKQGFAEIQEILNRCITAASVNTGTCSKIFYKMKKLLLVLTMAVCFAGAAMAQPGGRGQNPEAMVQALKDSLQLSDKQVDSVKAIIQEFMPKQREIFMNQDLDREGKMAALKQINDQRNARFKAVLTEEQYKKYQDMEERRRQRMAAGRGPGGR